MCETKKLLNCTIWNIANVHKPFFSSLAYSEKHNQLLAHFTSVKKSYLYIHIKVIDAMLEAKGKKKQTPN
jgi:hypothetical protein